ncbi:hypothetical protein BV22DRAFT_1124949 [Leucogyrophana mollusca]|uniref:Uncharacterized protein n=1 Tax=Leucogyrophana mollusca TaxID=85980 RepID=A0ACB8BXX9_9AGAM|nr:hypothetical protein BV22DRAFT_1124949 [Leucogyrophana mollusca]
MSYGYSQYPLREEPSTYFDEPSAYINEPSAYINEPSAYFDGPSAYFGEPSAYFNEPSSDIPVEDSQDPFGSDTVHEAAAPASPQDNLNQILPLNPYPAWPHGGYSTGAEIDHPVPPEAISTPYYPLLAALLINVNPFYTVPQVTPYPKAIGTIPSH